MYNCLCHSVHCSMMLHRVKVCSVHPRHFRKPACSCLSRWSTASEIRLMMSLARILLGTDRKVTPLQLFKVGGGGGGTVLSEENTNSGEIICYLTFRRMLLHTSSEVTVNTKLELKYTGLLTY